MTSNDTLSSEGLGDDSKRTRYLFSEKCIEFDRSSAFENMTRKKLEETTEPDTLPEYLLTLVEGSEVCGDSYVPFSKPDWFDMEKFRRGQKFAINNIFGVLYCQLISLLMLFAFPGSLNVLMFTKKSDTPFNAFKRYFSTASRVKSWYEGDIWDVDSVAHKNLKTVRIMHQAARNNITRCPSEVLCDEFKISDDEGHFPTLVEQHEEIVKEFQSSCPFLQSKLSISKKVHISQYDMAITQFGFAGLLLLLPEMFGIHGASNEDLDGFAHFWRTIGYVLGIEDRYNLCHGDLPKVRQRCRDIVTFYVRPSLREISRDWLHMSRCVFDGLNYFIPCSTFELILLYFCNVLEIQTPKLEASLNFVQYCVYRYNLILYSILARFPVIWALHNWLLCVSMQIYNIVFLTSN